MPGLTAGIFPIDSAHNRVHWPGGSVVIDVTVEPQAVAYDPGTLLAWSALRQGDAILRHKPLLSTNTEQQRQDALWRFCDWWNRVAVPTMELIEWANGMIAPATASAELDRNIG
jgi:hypothetical protein